MSVLQVIETALSGIGFAIGAGQYPAAADPCCKIVFIGEEKPVRFMGGDGLDVETFKVIIRGDSYALLESKATAVKSKLQNAGFIPIGGLEDIEPKEDENFMQIAVSFKAIKKVN